MARRLREGLWLLELGLVAPLRSNAYLLDDALLVGGPETAADHDATRASDDVTLCDTGLYWNRPSLRDELTAAGYAPADLDRVILTHYDLDHVGGLGRLLPDFGGAVHIGGPDHAILNGDAAPPAIHHKGLFHRVARRLFPPPAGLELRPVTDGERIGRFTAYVTPGHNPGHVVYVHDAGVALLGDLVWEDDGALTTPIRLDSYDLAALRESVRDVATRAGPFDVAAMGHGTPILDGGDDALRILADSL